MKQMGAEIACSMINLTIKIPDDLVRSLEGLAAAQHKSVEELAVEEENAGSAAAVSRAMRETPHLTAADVDERDRGITAGRLAVRPGELFPGQS